MPGAGQHATAGSWLARIFPLLAFALGAACRRSEVSETPAVVETAADAVAVIRHVVVIAMENADASMIYGNVAEAPYINGTLIPRYAVSTTFYDSLPLELPSEPHYVWMEAGTNSFSDHTFTDDDDPSPANCTADTNHLTTQIQNAKNGLTWRTYQEGLDASTGACPIYSSGLYAPKHNPFVFFQDVVGNPPSASSRVCVAHHRPYDVFAKDLKNGDVASYTFITPNLCHDMHGASGCRDTSWVRQGDDWLSTELPRIIEYVDSHAGVIFVEWDEGAATALMPFIAIGPGVKVGYASRVRYGHGSVLKSIEAILGLPALARVAGERDLSDLFRAGQYP
ncbi:MAG TPA: alkaline phosphatase family protein [Polyangiaceae bacterium]|nr:alkaline phosphatase family protein [Polyangiaceae bacterium]